MVYGKYIQKSDLGKRLKTSIFAKLFVPVIIIMLIQAAIINIFLFAGGIIDELENNALDVLAKNVQTRGINLEHLMVNYWSNIGRLEHDIVAAIDAYLETHGLDLEDFWGVGWREVELLHYITESLIDTLRVTSATGVFMYFLDPGGFDEDVFRLNGLYYRSLSPLAQRGQMSLANLMLVRGPVDIARKDNIPLDSLWDELFTFDPQYEDLWRAFAYPQIAFSRFPDADADDLSYWNRPHVLNPWSPRDAGRQITYSRPIIIDGQVVAIVGTEMQLSRLEQHFPARDLDNFSESGYMLVRFSQGMYDYFPGEVFQIAGSFMNRLLGTLEEVTFIRSGREEVYSLLDNPEVYLVMHPLLLYNSHAPFAGEQWALVAMGTGASLFEMSRNVNNAVFISTALAAVAGGMFLIFAIKNFTKPISQIIRQIKESDGSSVLPGSKTYEIDLLCQTINEMVNRRRQAEISTLEERQRYLLALENSADTFMEYDIKNDELSVYYFTKKQQSPSVMNVKSLSQVVATGRFMHPEDAADAYTGGAFASGTMISHVCRIQPEFLPHLDNNVLDNGYFWVHITMRYITDADGAPSKVIGTVKEITREKLREQAALETIRRDLTTGFYSRHYGLQMLENNTSGAFLPYMLRINNFAALEVAYGRVFGAIFMAEFAHRLSLLQSEGDLAVRLGNDEFLLCFAHEGDWPTLISDAFARLYSGEEMDAEVSLSIQTLDTGDVDHIKNLSILPEKPISVHLDLHDTEALDDVVLELFERTLHINSSVMILIGAIGRLFGFDRVIIKSCDSTFGTTQIIRQWQGDEFKPLSGDIRKMTLAGFERFNRSLNAYGTLVYHNNGDFDAEFEPILCLTPESGVTYCCEIYEDAANAGRMLYVSKDADKTLSEDELDILHTITKIIATYMRADKSRSASNAKSMFLSRVSHEIRTPMNAIIGLTNIALASDHDYARVRDALSKIRTSANYLLALINDVLEMSRVESGRLIQIENNPFCLASLVNSVEQLMRFAIEERGLSFHVHSQIENSRVLGDENRLRQVIINLLGNANKFTRPGGAVGFTVNELSPGAYKFSVKDTGIGIPIDKQSGIFNPFEQVYSTTSPGSMQGTGLGLAISKSIIHAMKSRIELQSMPGVGSEFSFTLDLRLHEQVTDADYETTDADTLDYTRFAGRRLLSVDDVNINLEIVSFILEQAGIVVESARNGLEALDKFLASEVGYYDAILMDIQMPVMDGITATSEIRKSQRADARTVPILAITANAFDEDLKKSIESGMDGHISKPLQEGELWSALKKFLES